MIAVDVDDTLNDFNETLKNTEFAFDRSYGLTEETFDQYIKMVKSGEESYSKLVCDAYTYFKFKIHQQCYSLAQANAEGVALMRWLHRNGWRIVICTARDLRLSYNSTKNWLETNGIPYDDMFMAVNKVVFCRMWGIEHLIDDDPLNIQYGRQYGVNVYYPMMEKHALAVENGWGRGFRGFEEVKGWI